MANQKDLVVKMTVNSQDFDKGLKNAKSSMNQFSANANNVSKSFNAAMGSMVKKIGWVGVALAAKDGFKQFAKSTEQMADGWRNEMGAMSDAWKSFLFIVNNGNFVGFEDLIRYARQARQALDELGDAAALFGLDYGANSARGTELLSAIQKKKKSGQDYSAEVAEYNQLVDQLRRDNKLANDRSFKALEGLFGQKGINIGDYGVSYMEAARLARLSAAGAFPDVAILSKAYNAKRDISEINDFSPDLGGDSELTKLRKEWGMVRFNQADFLRTLGNITTEDKEMIEKVLKEISQRDQAVATMEKSLNRYLAADTGNGGGGGRSRSVQSRAAVDLVPGLSPLSAIPTDDTIQRMEALNKKLAYTYDLERMNAEMALEWQMKIDKMNLYADTIGSVANAFNAMSDAMGDTPFGAFVSTMGTVAQQISNLVSMYSSLVAVEAVAESIKAGNGIPFPYNLIAIAASVAALATIISSAKSNFAGQFANGGVVGGNSYTGDKLWARVNSGEVILNRQQAATVFGGSSSNVRFVIEGNQLQGVLDNNSKINNL